MFRVAYTVRVFVLAGFIASHLGLPTIEPAQQRSGARFPCQGHACGCTSAEHCWNHCCCISLSDRLTWAEENDVKPPEGLKLTAEKSFVSKPAKKCCEHSSLARERVQNESAAEQGPRIQWVLTIQAMKCRSQSFYWMVVAQPALATDASMKCHFDQPMCGQPHDAEDHLESFSIAPLLPYG